MIVQGLLLRGLQRFVPYLPSRWRLACGYRLTLLGDCEPELRHLRRLAAPGGCAVDAGANFGWYAYAMARSHEQVHAFEPNPAVSQALRAWRNPRVHVHSLALAASRGTSTLRIPIQDGVALGGWASLGQGRLQSATDFVELEVATKPLDDFGLSDVRLIKIDVEGYEMEVLSGARRTLEESRPMVIVEVDETNTLALARFASNIGYAVTTLLEQTGLAGSDQNRILVPTHA